MISRSKGTRLVNSKVIDPFYISAYRHHTIMMILVSTYTWLRLANLMGTFLICIIDVHLAKQDGHHKICVFHLLNTSEKFLLRTANTDNNPKSVYNDVTLNYSDAIMIHYPKAET